MEEYIQGVDLELRFDTAALNKLRQLTGKGEPDFLNELIDDFLLTAPPVFEQLRLAVNDRECRKVEKLAHKLKGSCRNLGLKKVAALFDAIERKGTTGELSGMAALLGELETEFQTTCGLLKENWKLAA